MGSKSILGVSSMPDRCRACVASNTGQVKITPDIDLDSMEYYEIQGFPYFWFYVYVLLAWCPVAFKGICLATETSWNFKFVVDYKADYTLQYITKK